MGLYDRDREHGLSFIRVPKAGSGRILAVVILILLMDLFLV
jgi:hypothetical protein